MPRATIACILFALLVTSSALAQPAVADRPSSSPTQVVYVLDGPNLLTYDIGSNLEPTLVGSFAFPELTYPYLVPAPNGHFLYYMASEGISGQEKNLWVYATNESGSPQAPALQELKVNGLYSSAIDPSSRFFYAVTVSAGSAGYQWYTIWRFLIDRRSGMLSQPLQEARYLLPAGADSEDCGLDLDGFNHSGTVMYEYVECSAPYGSGRVTYNMMVLNLHTGELGEEHEIYSWIENDEGSQSVQFAGDLMFNFGSPDNYQQGVSWVNIYPLQPATAQPLLPLVQCTATMLYACGYGGGVAYISGEYVFLSVNNQAGTLGNPGTVIDKVDLAAGEIVPTGTTIPFASCGGNAFSPDGNIAYACNYQNQLQGYSIGIYGFDAATAKVTVGGTITVPSGLDSFFVAERY